METFHDGVFLDKDRGKKKVRFFFFFKNQINVKERKKKKLQKRIFFFNDGIRIIIIKKYKNKGFFPHKKK